MYICGQFFSKIYQLFCLFGISQIWYLFGESFLNSETEDDDYPSGSERGWVCIYHRGHLIFTVDSPWFELEWEKFLVWITEGFGLEKVFFRWDFIWRGMNFASNYRKIRIIEVLISENLLYSIKSNLKKM